MIEAVTALLCSFDPLLQTHHDSVIPSCINSAYLAIILIYVLFPAHVFHELDERWSLWACNQPFAERLGLGTWKAETCWVEVVDVNFV